MGDEQPGNQARLDMRRMMAAEQARARGNGG